MDKKKHGRRYSKEDDDYLRKHYPSEKTEDVAKALNRNTRSVKDRAEKLGVKKTEEFRRQMYLNWGAKTRYGMNGRINRTPIRRRIGSIRNTPYGKQIRTKERIGRLRSDWEYLHRVIWKEHYGEIPEDCVVIFKDGNKDNLEITNLELMKKNEYLKLISNQYAKINPLLVAISKLNKEIKRIEEDGK